MLMESTPHSLTRRLLQVVLNPCDGSDRELLVRFIATRDEAAFAELVRRHGRMVLAVARRVTGHSQDAEDAFQAAFLVLARRASQIRQPDQLANWLYGVAYRTALEARAARRRVLEQPVSAVPDSTAPLPQDDHADVRRVIDEELAALPEKYRTAVVLCDLEGLTRAEAAVKLKIPEGTLSSRLAHARKMLAARLVRRGVTATASGLAVTLGREAVGGAVPRELLHNTAHAAALMMTRGAMPHDLVPPSVSHLTEGVMKLMLATRLRTSIAAAALACGLLGLGAYGVAQQLAPTQPTPPSTAFPQSNQPRGQDRQNASGNASPKVMPRGIEDEDVPIGQLPVQAVVRIEDGKLIIRQRVSDYTIVKHRSGNESAFAYQLQSRVGALTILDPAELAVFDVKGSRLAAKAWMEKLKNDTHALIEFHGKVPNPRDLTLFKDDVLVIVMNSMVGANPNYPPAIPPAPATPAPPLTVPQVEANQPYSSQMAVPPAPSPSYAPDEGRRPYPPLAPTPTPTREIDALPPGPSASPVAPVPTLEPQPNQPPAPAKPRKPKPTPPTSAPVTPPPTVPPPLPDEVPPAPITPGV
jgi:RNA polymerase sigma factor (sigma-70 family)